jgi:predicted RecA/RadA family phage recombinase
VAPVAIPANELGSVDVEGEFAFPKATGSASALSAGTKVYWDAGDETVGTDSSGNKVAGYTTKAAAADDDEVRVKLARA